MTATTREIKFRAWVTNHPDVLGTAIPDQMTDEFDFTDFDGDYFVPLGCYYSYMKLMQYTGLEDKNGKEIYEGDIVTITGEDVRLVIEWAWNSYNFKGTADWDITNHDTERELEVIGNVYENPELLKT